MPFGCEVLGVFVELRAWRTLAGWFASDELDRLAIHFLLSDGDE